MPSEILGKEIASSPGLAELLRQVNSGTYKGAVDISRERFPDPGEHFQPVERDQQGIGGAPSSLEAQPTEAPAEVIPLPPGLVPTGGQGRVEDQVPAVPSRRASVDSVRTISEPEPLPTATPLDDSQPLETIAEETNIEEETRPNKAPRREPPADSSTSADASEERNTRVPGSPVGPLMQSVNNRDPPPPQCLWSNYRHP